MERAVAHDVGRDPAGRGSLPQYAANLIGHLPVLDQQSAQFHAERRLQVRVVGILSQVR